MVLRHVALRSKSPPWAMTLPQWITTPWSRKPSSLLITLFLLLAFSLLVVWQWRSVFTIDNIICDHKTNIVDWLVGWFIFIQSVSSRSMRNHWRGSLFGRHIPWSQAPTAKEWHSTSCFFRERWEGLSWI